MVEKIPPGFLGAQSCRAETSLRYARRKKNEKIEKYIIKNFGGHICCCYGCSLGGSYAAYLVQRKKIHIDHVVIGSSDMDSAGKFAAGVESRIITPILYKIVSEGKVPGWLSRKVVQRKKEDPEMGRQLERCVRE